MNEVIVLKKCTASNHDAVSNQGSAPKRLIDRAIFDLAIPTSYFSLWRVETEENMSFSSRVICE